MFPINTAVEVAGLTSSAPLNGLRGIVVAGALDNGRVPVMLAGRNQPIAIKPANLRLADACFVCADAHLHGFHFDTDPPLFEINCDCDGDRFMHLECAVGLGGTDVGNSWRQCPTCHGKYGDHTFANAVAEEAWATFKDATGPPGSGTMIDIQRLQAMYALAAVKLKEGHFDEAERLLSQHVLACEQLAVADPLISSLSRILASKSKMDLGNVSESSANTQRRRHCAGRCWPSTRSNRAKGATGHWSGATTSACPSRRRVNWRRQRPSSATRSRCRWQAASTLPSSRASLCPSAGTWRWCLKNRRSTWKRKSCAENACSRPHICAARIINRHAAPPRVCVCATLRCARVSWHERWSQPALRKHVEHAAPCPRVCALPEHQPAGRPHNA